MDRASRRSFVDLAARRQRPGSGSDLTWLMAKERIRRAWWEETLDLLHDVLHAMVGGVAVAKYAPQRQTADLDLVVAAENASRAEQALAAHGYLRQGRLSIGGTTWRKPDGNAIDVIYLTQPWAARAIAEAQDNLLFRMPVLPLPYLVLLKLAASRTVDLADVSRMLGAATEEVLDRVRQVTATHLSEEDRAALEQLIRLGKMEAQEGESRE